MINKQMARQYLSTILGKAVKKAASMRGGGSALPGLVIEKIDPGFLTRTLKQLPHGVVIISGTNGKTTTTKIVVELLESAGMKVFTNRTGSNFSRGVAAALLGEIDMRGRLDADIAVLELDEAWAAKFVERIKPRYSLILNVLRDQLDRFGEIDNTARLLGKIVEATTDLAVLNREDPRVYGLKSLAPKTAFFGTTSKLLSLMPTDDALKSGKVEANIDEEADVLLTKISDQTASFKIDSKEYNAKLLLGGVYNILNSAAALSLVKQILKSTNNQTSIEKLLSTLEAVRPAFGRGEVIMLDQRPIELILVKNPSGFRLALLSFSKQKTPTMIAVNDNYADGRDMSWLWDVDFSGLEKVDIVSGIRAYDMSLRLKYDEVPVDEIIPDLNEATDELIQNNPGTPLRIFTTYTAMLKIRKRLSNLTKVERVQ